MANIKIQDVLQRVQYTASNPTQAIFAVPFPFLDNTELLVYQDSTLLDLGTAPGEYGVTGAGSPSGGTVTLVTAATVGTIITILGDMPVDRTSIYSPTISNLTGSDLNSDFNREVIMLQQSETTQDLLQLQYYPYAEVSQDPTVTIDRWLPLLGARQSWRKNAAGTAIEAIDIPDGDLAPGDATYIVQTADGDLANAQAMGDLASGISVSTATTGVQLTRILAGTANQLGVNNADGITGNPTYYILDNPYMPGTTGMQIPSGTTAQRVTPISPAINLRYNTDNTAIEYYDHGVTAWVTLETASIGGVVNSIQWNNAGVFDGTANFTTDGSTVAITGDLDVDNININGNTIISTDAGGDINLTPSTTGDLVLDGQKWPQADGAAGQIIVTDGAGQLSWVEDLALDAQDYFTGIITEHPDVSVSSDGATITLSIEKDGGGNLEVLFSTGKYAWTTAPATVALTAGTAAVPVLNYVYLLESSKVLTASTVGFPAAEYAAVAEVYVATAALVQTDGAYMFHQWTNGMEDHNKIGHSSHINLWIRHQPATWLTGVVLTPTVGVATFDIATTSGTILQLHEHTLPAFDTGAASWVYVPNDSVAAYAKVTDMATMLTDANGVSMSNKRFNIVVWAVISQDSGDCQLYANLPTASYDSDAAAISDTDSTSVFNIPVDFRGTGFLISRLSIRHISSSGTWSLLQNEDLRGITPGVATGSGAGGINAVVDDPTPELGGNLDGGGFDVSNVNELMVGTTSSITNSSISVIGTNGITSTGSNHTDATNKTGGYCVPHYTNAEQPVALIIGNPTATNNNIFVGGGLGAVNAATQIRFYTGANTTTTTGTERGRIDSAGKFLWGTAVAPTKGSFNVVGGGYVTTSDTMADAATKYGFFTASHYTTAEEPAGGMHMVNSSANNITYLGGGNSNINTATQIRFYTAVNTTTVIGTEVVRFTTSGMSFDAGVTSVDAILDDDTMAADDPNALATQQSIKAYVDASAGGGGSIQAWVNFTSVTTTAINDSFNVTSVTDNGTGNTTITFTTNFANANYAATCAIGGSATAGFGLLTTSGTYSVSQCQVSSVNSSANPLDILINNWIFTGDQ